MRGLRTLTGEHVSARESDTPLDLWSGWRRNIIAQANTLRRPVRFLTPRSPEKSGGRLCSNRKGKMGFIYLLLFGFGAYRVWIRPSFLGAEKQWAKLLLFTLTGGISSIALLFEAFFGLFRRNSSSTSPSGPSDETP